MGLEFRLDNALKSAVSSLRIAKGSLIFDEEGNLYLGKGSSAAPAPAKGTPSGGGGGNTSANSIVRTMDQGEEVTLDIPEDSIIQIVKESAIPAGVIYGPTTYMTNTFTGGENPGVGVISTNVPQYIYGGTWLAPWKAVDGAIDEGGGSFCIIGAPAVTPSSPVDLIMEFDTAKTLNAIKIIGVNSMISGRSIKDFQIEASNDGVNYTTLKSVVGEVFTTAYQVKEYLFANDTAYKFYRIRITKTVNNGGEVQIAEVNFGEGSSPMGEASILVTQSTLGTYLQTNTDFSGKHTTSETFTLRKNISGSGDEVTINYIS